MMQDGTAYLATKRDLEFSVCSDFDNAVAKEFQIAFTIEPHSRPFLKNWGENVPEFNGVDSWEIPLPATYVIAQDGRIAWSFIDNDPGIRAGVQDVLHQVAAVAEDANITNFVEDNQSTCSSTTSARQEKKRKIFNRTVGCTFKPWRLKKLWPSKREKEEVRSELEVEPMKRTPRRAQSAKEFLGKYMLPAE